MKKKAHPGQVVKLTIAESTEGGFLLDNEEEQVFLALEDTERILKVGQEIEVFLYHNEREDVVATTTIPQASIGNFAAYKAKSVASMGAFFDIGVGRDVLVPTRAMQHPIEAGKRYVITLMWDPIRRKLGGTTRVHAFLSSEDLDYERGQEVQVQLYDRIAPGWKVIVNGKHPGLLLEQEVHRKPKHGEKMKAYVKKVDQDGILVSPQKEGIQNLLDSQQVVMQFLEMNGGYARLGDKTDAEEIKLRLRMSKKTFKSAIGMLSKQNKISITKHGIKLVK